MSGPPAHLGHLHALSPEEQWAQYRANGCDILAPWPDEDDEYLGPTLLGAAEIVHELEEAGGSIEINMDILLPDDVPALTEDDWAWILAHEHLIKELLRLDREATYNLRAASESANP